MRVAEGLTAVACLFVIECGCSRSSACGGRRRARAWCNWERQGVDLAQHGCGRPKQPETIKQLVKVDGASPIYCDQLPGTSLEAQLIH